MKRHLLRFIAVLMAIITIAGCIPAGREVRTIAAEKKAVTVKSVEALIKAMKDPNVVTIKFKSSKEISITIPSNKKAKNKKLSISASNAAVVNDAKFKSITLKSIGSYEENANGNSITVKDDGAKIRIAWEGASCSFK